ncbi:MAG: tetratricopeptide repeat protein [Flavobacteriales bacterium]|nr:tetratricopeptide repeat protein [Flavobacteriales bacterium]
MKLRISTKLLLFLTAAVALWACSNKKDGTSYRVYHNMTAHYNGYFNADELVDKGAASIRKAHKEDYDKILPMFIYGTDETAKASYPDMEKAIGKCEKVISKHTIKDDSHKDKKRPEFNKWIDENYLVIGKAYFYKRNYFKAAEVFQYANRKFKNPVNNVVSNSWLARAYIEQEEYGKAIQALTRAETDAEDERVSDDVKAEYHMVFTDVLLHQKKYEKAAEELEKAIPLIKRKKDRARPTFILAQIYQQLDRSSDALTAYETCIRSRPVYELEFHARINKALSYSRTGGSSGEIQKELFKMLKDEKNLDYRDQIYFALGDIAWEEQRRTDAIDFYEKSLMYNKDNQKQKAKAFLRLADLYFDERKYQPAQLYYDSTLTTIDATHERYNIVKARAESLTELVASLNAIELNDSIAKICSLSPKEREKKMNELAKEIARQKEQQRLEDERRAEAAKQAAQESGITGSFWAYNEPLKEKGKANFIDKWGERPLKDNWRLQSILATSFGPGEEAEIPGVVAPSDSAALAEAENKYKAPSAEELSAELPCDDAGKLADLKFNAAEGYYNAGVIYKEKLNDVDNALSTWEELLANIDSSDFHPTTYYQLFRTWLAKETSKGYLKNPFCETCNSKYWGDEIKRNYPGSDWAMLVDNPGYLDIQDMKNAKEDEAYQAAYSMYSTRNYPGAKTFCDSIIKTEPDNHLVCKYRLLRAVCVGYSDAPYGVKENYQAELNAVVQNCGGSDEAKRAQELINAIGKPESSENINNEIRTDESTGTDNQVKPDTTATMNVPEIVNTDSPYKYDGGAEHYFAVFIPVQGSDINKSKTAVADFNSAFFTSSQLKVTNNLLDKNNHLLLIKSFKKMDEATNYMKAFRGDGDKLAEINLAQYRTVLISKQNYITLFKNKDIDQYMDFYAQFYEN